MHTAKRKIKTQEQASEEDGVDKRCFKLKKSFYKWLKINTAEADVHMHLYLLGTTASSNWRQDLHTYRYINATQYRVDNAKAYIVVWYRIYLLTTIINFAVSSTHHRFTRLNVPHRSSKTSDVCSLTSSPSYAMSSDSRDPLREGFSFPLLDLRRSPSPKILATFACFTMSSACSKWQTK